MTTLTEFPFYKSTNKKENESVSLVLQAVWQNDQIKAKHTLILERKDQFS